MKEKIKVAIAEDEIAYRKLLIQSLQPYRRNIKIIIEAPNGKELIKLIEIQMPDVILLDLRMPIMDGLKTTKILSEKYPRLKILILTARNEESLFLQLIGAGAHGFLLKNLSIKEIVRKIQLANNDEYGLKGWDLKRIVNAKKDKTDAYNFNGIEFTPRETEISSLLNQGLNYKKIADKLCISARTAEWHTRNMIKKAGVADRPELISFLNDWYSTSNEKK